MSEYISIPVDLSPTPWGWIALAVLGVLIALGAGTLLLLTRDLAMVRARKRLLWGLDAAGVVTGSLGGVLAATNADPTARERQAIMLEAVEGTWDVEVLLPATLPASPAAGEYRVPLLVSGQSQPTMCTLAAKAGGDADVLGISLWCGGDPAPRR